MKVGRKTTLERRMQMQAYKLSGETQRDWFVEALAMRDNEELMIPCQSKTHQTMVKNQIEIDKHKWAKLDPVNACQIRIERTGKRDGLYWVRLKRDPLLNPLWVWKTDSDGRQYKIKLSIDPVQIRRIRHMVEDGLDFETISKLENLSVEEIKLLLERR